MNKMRPHWHLYIKLGLTGTQKYHEANMRQAPANEHFNKHMMRKTHELQGHQKAGMMRKLSQIERLRSMMSKCDVKSWLSCHNRKIH